MKESILKTKSFDYAVESVFLYKQLIENKEFILSKQFVRSATSVGANIREANNAQSLNDFIHKLNICQKECDESMYWLELLHKTEYLCIEDFLKYNENATQILKILKKSIQTSKQKLMYKNY